MEIMRIAAEQGASDALLLFGQRIASVQVMAAACSLEDIGFVSTDYVLSYVNYFMLETMRRARYISLKNRIMAALTDEELKEACLDAAKECGDSEVAKKLRRATMETRLELSDLFFKCYPRRRFK